MIHVTDIYSLKAKLFKLKHQLDQEHRYPGEKELVHKYLNKVLDYVDELQLY
jgi:hypothetical protein